MGKSAQDSTGFRFPDGGGNDIGKYKQPEKVGAESDVYERGETLSRMNISVGNSSKNAMAPTNPYGVKQMRGAGAATTGKKISGKQG